MFIVFDLNHLGRESMDEFSQKLTKILLEVEHMVYISSRLSVAYILLHKLFTQLSKAGNGIMR